MRCAGPAMDYEDVPAPAPVIPGLAWPGAVSLLVAGPKWGKTTLLAHGCAAALGGQPFIGETGEKLTGPILYYSEMPVPMLRSWIGRHVGAARPPLYAGRVAHLAAMQGDAARYRPGIIIVDSFVEALKRWDPRSDEWKAGDVRLWFASLRELAGRAGVIVTQDITEERRSGARLRPRSTPRSTWSSPSPMPAARTELRAAGILRHRAHPDLPQPVERSGPYRRDGPGHMRLPQGRVGRRRPVQPAARPGRGSRRGYRPVAAGASRRSIVEGVPREAEG